MAADASRDFLPLQDSDLSNLISNLSAGERPTPTGVIGGQRFPSMEDLLSEMKQHPIARERNMLPRLEMFARAGVVPLVSDTRNGKLILGINYMGRDNAIRDAAEIDMSLENDVLPYNGYQNSKLEIVLLDPAQFAQLNRLVHDNALGMNTTGRIPTVLQNPTTRETFYGMVTQAVQNRVSDIHIEPLASKLSRVRFRIDGSLTAANVNLTHESYKHVVSIVKGDAELKLDENRRPQGGRIIFDEARLQRNPELRGYSLRVSIAPMSHGEKVVMRILKEQKKSCGLESLGYPSDLYGKIRDLAESPDGLILVTGPTGSGKTTTLYSILNHLNREDVNIMTIEDPIESNIPGINQSLVKEDIGWGFGSVLRTYVRQDPDVILVGEIRDSETARAALEAAKTGHLVLSTLHTTDSVSTLLRLYELGAADSDLQSSLNGVIAQRLARKVCPACKTEYNAAAELNALFDTDAFSDGPILYRGKGIIENDPCQKCNGIGYYERMVIPEVWVVGDEEKNLIGEGCKSIAKYYDLAMKNGLKPLYRAGMEAVISGKTTLDEILSNVVKRSALVKRKKELIDMIVGAGR